MLDLAWLVRARFQLHIAIQRRDPMAVINRISSSLTIEEQ